MQVHDVFLGAGVRDDHLALLAVLVHRQFFRVEGAALWVRRGGRVGDGAAAQERRVGVVLPHGADQLQRKSSFR